MKRGIKIGERMLQAIHLQRFFLHSPTTEKQLKRYMLNGGRESERQVIFFLRA